MKATVLLFLSLIAGALSGLAFQGNVTLSNQGDFKFRLNDFTQFSIIGIYNGAFLASLSVDANPQSATVDGLYGAAYAGISAPPSAYVSFFSSSSQWTFGGNNYAAANTSNAAAFIGKVFVSLDEVDANGNAVQTILLKSLIWTTSDANTGKGGLRYVTFKGVPISLTSNFVVLVTYVSSDVVGVLNVVGTAIVTPKSFESIIEIDNFPYQNTANSIRLNIATASATASVVAQGAVTHLVSGTGNNGAYFTLDNKAAVNGQAAPVSISAFVTGSGTVTYGNADLDLQVRLKYGAAATFKLVSVTFPAGAVKIVYDPAIGAGANPPASPADRTVPFFIALFIAMLLLL